MNKEVYAFIPKKIFVIKFQSNRFEYFVTELKYSFQVLYFLFILQTHFSLYSIGLHIDISTLVTMHLRGIIDSIYFASFCAFLTTNQDRFQPDWMGQKHIETTIH